MRTRFSLIVYKCYGTFVSIIPTHATTLDLFQRGQFGPAPKHNVYADRTKRKRSIESMGLCQSIREYVMESVQLIRVPPEGLMMNGSNTTNACIRKPA